ncbi:SOS response-associated peptidase [Pseudolabrys taiwanensis]|nr:SOS response-associated peptidase [Pseudolabrys taiwanensis]
MYTWEELVRLYRLTDPYMISNLQPRYNICPTTTVDTVVEVNGNRQLVPMRWGLIPAWWSKPLNDMKLATFNARAETVDTKPMFRSAFKKNRCIIPASGYYEWQTAGKQKLPWYFTPTQEPILSIAGIWDEWTDKETGKALKSCAMLITEPNKLAAEIHDRMPVLLQPEQFGPWLHGESGKEALLPANDNVLRKVRVSPRVNSFRALDEDGTLIDPVKT